MSTRWEGALISQTRPNATCVLLHSHPHFTDSLTMGLSKKQLSLLVLVIQNSTLVLMMRYSRIVTKSPGQPMYIASTAVFLAEVLKIVACLAVMYYQKRNFSRFLHVVQKEILEKPGETIKMLIPSGLYALQNNLLYIALSNLEAATFQVTYQMKILTTALFSVVLLGRSLSQNKWFALVLLMIGVTLVQLQTVSTSSTPTVPTAAALAAISPEDDPNGPDAAATAEAIAAVIRADAAAAAQTTATLLAAQNPLVGLLAVVTSCVSSGFAGCYFEKILKTSDTSMWVRNIQLGISGALFSFIGIFVYDRERIMDGGIRLAHVGGRGEPGARGVARGHRRQIRRQHPQGVRHEPVHHHIGDHQLLPVRLPPELAVHDWGRYRHVQLIHLREARAVGGAEAEVASWFGYRAEEILG
ncbi:nucleotide-sugar transporter-domain-containing protein [Jimgerdemannia flammicorona]|uniref:Nucleotide-sugar transporter-domain-containing protein n=1 Tax=Jimgerdemannia flammicorona TaxID=994334 RepID=A0A433BA82_9FUNG|nr:nucleotide-sugar transporter-domain-containing protein [Jimgerdemannia flammicorona]